MGSDGRNGSAKPKKEFPPAWVAGALRATITTTRLAVLAAMAYGTLLAAVHVKALQENGQLAAMYEEFLRGRLDLSVPHACAAAALVAVAALLVRWWRRERTYMLEFYCYRPPEHLRVTSRRFLQGSRDAGVFNAESMEFQERILKKSALSEETFVPPTLHLDPPRPDMHLAREEAELVMFGAVEGLLKRTGLSPRQVDVLVVNCSLFNPTPSLSAMIINHFKMRSDIESFSLGGMGCSAGILAVDVARKLLARRPGGYALVVSTENMSQNWYQGNQRSMLIPNTIFRMGSVAVMLTNKLSERRRARYELQHLVRVHLGADDEAYHCVYQHQDEAGVVGVELDRNLVKVAARALEVNMTRLGPLVLPWSEKLMFAANWVARKGLGMRCAPYIPDFKRAFDHFCLHAGGRGVVEGLSKQLGLPADRMAPSANTLYWYGNTSSSTVWYSLGFVETVQGVAKGQLVWQVGFGSGFKCNSAVWRALRPIKVEHDAWKTVLGREGEALEALNRLAAESAQERLQKAKEQPAGETGATNGHATAVHVNGHAPAAAGQRALRNGKVLA